MPYGLFRTIAGSIAPPRRQIRSLSVSQNDGDGSCWSKTSTTVRVEAHAGKEANEEIERAAGFQSDKKIRKVVERHAMDLASDCFWNAGYDVKDVSSGRPYDLLCTRRSDVKYVEVKGTQEGGHTVVLTAGEVRFIKNKKSDCVLCVVHDITINDSHNPKASGGRISLDNPLDLSAGVLSPINYFFKRAK